MYQTALKTTQLGQTDLQITRVGFGAWAIGGGTGSTAGVRRTMQSPRSTARSRGDQLDRHRRRLRLRSLGAGRRARAARPARATVRVHEVLAAGRPRPQGPAQPQTRLGPARGRSQPRATRDRRDRPLPDPLADPRGGHRGGLGGARRGQRARPRPPHRRLELQRRAVAPDSADRAGRHAPAGALADRARRRAGAPPVRTPSAR
jgi:hypothetical protein